MDWLGKAPQPDCGAHLFQSVNGLARGCRLGMLAAPVGNAGSGLRTVMPPYSVNCWPWACLPGALDETRTSMVCGRSKSRTDGNDGEPGRTGVPNGLPGQLHPG